MKTMNKIFPGLLLATLLLAACQNDPIDFEDFTTQSVYFPLQTPIRTIVLGEDRIDNSIDLQKAFNIGVSIAGMYKNTTDRVIDFKLDPSLFPNLSRKDTLYGRDMDNVTSKLVILPTTYYSMVPDAKVTVPSGSLNGLIRVNLTDAFFNDPNAIKLTYVLPLKITAVPDGFTLLRGRVSAPSILLDTARWWVSTDWVTNFTPKDFTLFGVRFINPWHGTFFYRGVWKKDGVESYYHAIDISDNTTAKIETVGLKQATYNRMGGGANLGNAFKSLLTFSDDVAGIGDITVSQAPGTAYTISGTGKYYKSSTAFAKENGWTVDPLTDQIKGSLTVTLNFTVSSGLTGAAIHQFTDTLVLRDNGVRYDEFTVTRPTN